MNRQPLMTTVVFLLLGAAISGCSNDNSTAPTQKPKPSKFYLSLSHETHGVTSFPILVIVDGELPSFDKKKYTIVQISKEQVATIMSALDNCHAMTRQDSNIDGMPWPGWNLELSRMQGDYATHSFWNLSRKIDINLPGEKQDIFQAVRESLTGQARAKVEKYITDIQI